MRNPALAYFSLSSISCGNSSMHKPHQVDQKTISVYRWPRTESSKLNAFPSRSFPLRTGNLSPIFSPILSQRAFKRQPNKMVFPIAKSCTPCSVCIAWLSPRWRPNSIVQIVVEVGVNTTSENTMVVGRKQPVANHRHCRRYLSHNDEQHVGPISHHPKHAIGYEDGSPNKLGCAMNPKDVTEQEEMKNNKQHQCRPPDCRGPSAESDRGRQCQYGTVKHRKSQTPRARFSVVRQCGGMIFNVHCRQTIANGSTCRSETSPACRG